MAAFVYRFPQFIEWPPSALEGRETLDICVAEPDPFGTALIGLTKGEERDGRRITTRRISSPRMVEGCQVLFLSSVVSRASAFLEAAEGRPVLTIGESPDFLDRGGIINLLVVDHRIRFEIDADAATRAGLQLSSQLLGLAVAVRRAPSSGPGLSSYRHGLPVSTRRAQS